MWLDLQVQRRLQAAGQDFVLDVSLQCTQRQVVLFGPSGAGKSLTLKAVAGLLRPGQGHVRLQGQTLFDAAPAVDLPPQRRRLGWPRSKRLSHATDDFVAFAKHFAPGQRAAGDFQNQCQQGLGGSFNRLTPFKHRTGIKVQLLLQHPAGLRIGRDFDGRR